MKLWWFSWISTCCPVAARISPNRRHSFNTLHFPDTGLCSCTCRNFSSTISRLQRAATTYVIYSSHTDDSPGATRKHQAAPGNTIEEAVKHKLNERHTHRTETESRHSEGKRGKAAHHVIRQLDRRAHEGLHRGLLRMPRRRYCPRLLPQPRVRHLLRHCLCAVPLRRRRAGRLEAHLDVLRGHNRGAYPRDGR